ncbi:MAG: 50S ribosomal protein L30 [Ignavibacteriae bacterium]|nr:50S ribosomal protein L30 [Ignavibacteriota bacterium]MCB9216296.1 50S ribosomal protein L30 [Ignavibacteria bacterium]
MARIKVTQVRSTIDRSLKQKRTMKALGLGKINRTKTYDDRPEIRGMIRVVAHLVKVEEVN